ncbi:sulfatase-like hydrolase/transferase [Cohnella suwonensis]|uniref:Sulfatase-like hydrolase/transferase n=1 Tax=Cohnella suwonensis TaxID=696072 RepID=A0ABW0LX17_9BACL
MAVKANALLVSLLSIGLLVTGCSNNNDSLNAAATPSSSASSSPSPETPPAVTDAAKPNLIVIQLEAFQSFLLNRSAGDQEITPVLNEFIKESAYFPRFYLQNGAGNTSDAEFMANTSLHPLDGGHSIAMDAADKAFPGLPRTLKKEGYATLTLHTNNVMFWNRKELYAALGFDRFYDKSFFGTDNAIAFGASDDILYEKSSEVLSQTNQPFYAQLISMSSHYSYKIPDKYQSLTLPAIYEENMVGDYIEAAHYADEALGRFFEELQEKKLWDNTVVAIYGDHTGMMMNFVKEKEAAALKELLGRDYDQIDALGVPFIVHGPNVKAGQYDTVGGHLDIMPTLADVLNVQPEGTTFGYDLLKGAEHPVAVRASFAPAGSFVFGDSYYDTKLKKTTDLPSRKEIVTDETIQRLAGEVTSRFRQSDDYIKSLPPKENLYGTKLTVMEKTKAYEQKDESSKVVEKFSAGTVIDFFKNDGDWYQYADDQGNERWINVPQPMIEVYKKVHNPKKTKAYVEPDTSSKAPIEVGAQDLYALKEWNGTGWVQVSTWTGKDLWINVN